MLVYYRTLKHIQKRTKCKHCHVAALLFSVEANNGQSLAFNGDAVLFTVDELNAWGGSCFQTRLVCPLTFLAAP